MPMAPIANCAARDSKTRSRSSAAAERRSVASTPSLMRSRRGCGAAGRWAGARGIRQRVSFGARVPSSAREPRGREGARSRGSGKGNGGRSIRAPQRRHHQTRRRTRRCRRRRCGRRCPRRLPRPAGAGSGEAISVRQIRGRGVYGARARCAARGRGEGTRGGYARVPSRLFLTSRTSRSPRLAVRVRAMVRPRRGTRNGSLSTTRADRSKHSDHPAESARDIEQSAEMLTRPQAAVLRRGEVIVARATCTPATSTARAWIRRG